MFAEEFDLLKKNLSGLRVIHVITEDAGKNGENARLDQRKLKTLLSDCSRHSAVFVCGPPLMMKYIRKALVGIGFSKRFIFTERFNL